MIKPETRVYNRDRVISFRKTREAFGGLSNMAPGYPITLLGCSVRTAEALYQACRFPHLFEVQRMILDETSPMTAKMRSKPFRDQSRSDWDEVRVPVMKWCLRLKLACNWHKFAALLLETGDKPIVEDSRKDDYWGAKAHADLLEGRNVLGRLLMELREKLKADPASLLEVEPLNIPDFTLLGEKIIAIEAKVDNYASAFSIERDGSAPTACLQSDFENILLRLDKDVLNHFRKSGPGWQEQINAILRKSLNAS